MTETPAIPFSRRRTERRVRVHLPVEVHGTDRNGARFEERTTSENVCRSGVAFFLVHEPALGAELEVSIPLPSRGQRADANFSTRGQVRHIKISVSGNIVGVQFTGPRFHHIFVSESAEA